MKYYEALLYKILEKNKNNSLIEGFFAPAYIGNNYFSSWYFDMAGLVKLNPELYVNKINSEHLSPIFNDPDKSIAENIQRYNRFKTMISIKENMKNDSKPETIYFRRTDKKYK